MPELVSLNYSLGSSNSTGGNVLGSGGGSFINGGEPGDGSRRKRSSGGWEIEEGKSGSAVWEPVEIEEGNLGTRNGPTRLALYNAD